MCAQIRSFIIFGFLFSLGTNLGCTKTFYIKNPTPSSIVYDQKRQETTTLQIIDQRARGDEEFSTGTLTAVLKNMENEITFLGYNLQKALNARGINLSYVEEGEAEIKLNVKKYRIRNERTSALSPYWTFTTFSGTAARNGNTARITTYFKQGKVPVAAFREVEEPCYNIPISIMVKEIATKMNRYYFGLKAPDKKITELVDGINNRFHRHSYLDVLELGYANNRSAIDPLIKLLKHRDSMVRVCATSSLGMLGATEQFDLLKELYNKEENIEKTMALKSIGDLGTPEALDFVRSVKHSSDYEDQMIREVVDLYI